MKSLPLLIGSLAILLAGCVPQQPRHMSMNHGMMRQGTTVDAGGKSTLLSGEDIDLSTLPEAKPSEILEVKDGDTIELNPEIVKKTMIDPEMGDSAQSFAMYAYNGQFPGPLLKVKQGSTFTVRVKNGIDQPTTIHWHGVRLDNRFDGAAGVTQEAIEPGGSFTYTVTVPDDGIYWYHPHVREDVQQDLGLYGGLLVTPKDEDAYPPVNREEVIFLDDILLGDNGVPLSYGKNDADHALMGRFGNMFITNGIFNTSLNTVPTFDAPQNSVIRFYFINAANTRTFRLFFSKAPDASVKTKIIGSDAGRFERSSTDTNIILAPSERMIVDALFDTAGYYRIAHASGLPSSAVEEIAEITISSAKASDATTKKSFLKLDENQDVIADIDVFRPYFDKPIDHAIRLSVVQKMMGEMGHGMMMDHGSTADGIEWEDAMPMMNAVATKANTQWKLIDAATKKENMDIRYTFKKGDKVKIRIVNDTADQGSDHPMQHPIHFHGQRFLVLSVNGKPNENLAWKDTVLVPKDTTVDILLDVTNPGDWMIHCHIAEHLTNGMMGMFTVEE